MKKPYTIFRVSTFYVVMLNNKSCYVTVLCQCIILWFCLFIFLDKAIKENGRVLVHCVGGISRSSTIIIAYLMLKYDYSLNKAFDMVKIKKTNIAPNFNFMGQLLELERKRQDSPSLYPPGSISPGSSSISSEISTTSC